MSTESQISLGVVVKYLGDARASLMKVKNIGLSKCQLTCWNLEYITPENARNVKDVAEELDIEITSIWGGWPGPRAWNFTEGPLTLGLVPLEYRGMRMEALKQSSEFANIVGVDSVTTHIGFIPENPSDPLYPGLITAIKDVAKYCKKNGQEFWFETGQETPTTLLRAIQDIGLDNLGINLDPANLLLYGKANPLDAIDIFGQYIKEVHAKDGEYPTDGRKLGKEKPIGQGRVNFPVLIQKLQAIGYKGVLTIEREISGEKQIEDIKNSIEFLNTFL